jgi:hypothetical protein
LHCVPFWVLAVHLDAVLFLVDVYFFFVTFFVALSETALLLTPLSFGTQTLQAKYPFALAFLMVVLICFFDSNLQFYLW